MTDDELRLLIEEAGEEVLTKYIRQDEPTMFPPIPNASKYIDVYPKEEQRNLTQENLDDQRRQENYGAEVKMYRALENTDKKLVTLHDLSYTKRQYSLFVDESTNKNGQCDFVVVYKGVLLIIEVSDVRAKKEQDEEARERSRAKIRAAFDYKKKEQVPKTEKLATKIMERYGGSVDDGILILWFVAFPNLTKDNFTHNFSDDDRSRIISSDDLTPESFQSWWSNNVPENNNFPEEKMQHLSKMLIGLHCMNAENDCEVRHKCSLGRNILTTDKLLRDAKVTYSFGRQCQNPELYENPNIVKADDILQEMGIHYLTKDQNEVLKCDQNFLWINGPAGTGKSVLLCRKMVQLAREDTGNKIVLFRPKTDTENTGNRLYNNALNKTGVRYKLLEYSRPRISSEDLQKLITENDCKVIIVEVVRMDELLDGLSAAGNCHVFIDDFQASINHLALDSNKISTLINKLSELSLERTVWVACDLVQDYWFDRTPKKISDEFRVISGALSGRKVIQLSMNLRSARDISDTLCVIRDIHIESNYSNRGMINLQTPGHFIHGPKVVFHILASRTKGQVNLELNLELDKLKSHNDGFKNYNIAILCDKFIDKSWLKNTVEARCSKTDDKMAVFDTEYSFSGEWPAVIVFHELRDTPYGLPELYLKLSRARVYCAVILYPHSDERFREFGERFLVPLKEKLGNIAHFVQH